MATQSHNKSITIDNRETKLIELFRLANIPIDVSNLAIGDAILKHILFPPLDLPNERKITYELIIERKCVQDMVASIKDGRYKEQKIRLLAEANSQNPDRHVIIAYIIEGTPAELRSTSDKTMLLGSIISSTFRDKIITLRTYSLQETFDLLVRLNERLMKNYTDFFPIKIASTNLEPHAVVIGESEQIQDCGASASASASASYLGVIKKNKKDNMTTLMWNMNCLCGIPGVSSTIAIKIAEKFPTLRSLLDTYQSCNDIVSRENLLADIILTETDKQRRRIGNVISKRVYEYFHS